MRRFQLAQLEKRGRSSQYLREYIDARTQLAQHPGFNNTYETEYQREFLPWDLPTTTTTEHPRAGRPTKKREDSSVFSGNKPLRVAEPIMNQRINETVERHLPRPKTKAAQYRYDWVNDIAKQYEHQRQETNGL
jgi:hypothetical protein